MARYYWQTLSACLPVEFRFEDRNRQPAHDCFNASINYLYGMLYTYVETALFSVGLDPYLGIFHADQYDKPTLAFDVIEAFRYWVERVVMEQMMYGQIDASFFEKKDDGMWLGKKGKQLLIPEFNKYMAAIGEFNKTKIPRKNHIYRFCGTLLETITNHKSERA